jgi:hypothetical protein
MGGSSKEPATIAAVQFPSLAELRKEFAELFEAIEQSARLPEEQQAEESLALAVPAARNLLEELAAEANEELRRSRIDRLCQMIHLLELEEKHIRQIIQFGEQRARSLHRSARMIRESLQLAMEDAGLQRIEGLLHRLAVYRSPDRLVIANEQAIPDKYFDVVVRTTRELNRERLEADLRKGIEVPGAWLETDRRRLDVK